MIISEHHLTQHHFYRIKNKELGQIYTIMSIRSFVLSLVAIFIPIYIYTYTGSVIDVIKYNMFLFGFSLIFQPLAVFMISKFGPKHSIAASLPVLVLHLWMFWTLQQYQWPLWAVAFLGGYTLSHFWLAYHYDFSKAKSKKKASKQVSLMYISIALLSAIAPFVGGTIGTYLGLNFLFGFVTFILLMVAFPLFKNGEKHESKGFNLKRIKYDKYFFRQMISAGAVGVEASTVSVLWPLFVYIIMKSYQKIGFVTSLALLFTVVITYLVGKYGDKVDKCNFIRFGSVITGFIHMLRWLATSSLHVFGFNLATSISHSLYLSPQMTEYYLHADENSRLEYIYLGEFSTELMRIIFFGIILLSSIYFSESALITFGLIFGGLWTLLISIMPNAQCDLKISGKKIKVLSKLQKAAR